MIDPSAEIHPSATIAPGAVVGAHAVIGPDCELHPYAIVGAHTRLGTACVVHPFAVVGGPAQDRRTDPKAPNALICGDRNVFREGVTVSRGTEHGGGSTRLGHDNLLMAQAHIGHDCLIGDFNTLANGVSLAGHVQVANRVIFGGHAAVHQFARIGELAFVAANAMVSKDIPPYCMAAGDRARLCGLNTTGLRRANVPPATRAALKSAYHLLRRSTAEADGMARSPHPEVVALAAFYAASERGVLRG